MDHISQQILSWNKTTKLNNNNNNNNNSIISIIGWFIICQYYQFILTYILPLIPLLYYCYTTKKAHHLHLFDTIQYKIIHYLKRFRTWYISQYPPHLFLIGLYGYIGWVTLHQLVSTKWIITLLGYFFYSLSSYSSWYLKLYQHKDIQTLKQFLFPPLLISSEHLIQRALHYQQKFMIQSLDNEFISNSTSDPFTFIIYENQRQLPFIHTWHPFTFPFERKQWTDEYHHTVLSKDQFVLPSPVQSQDHHGKKAWNWVWIDSDWKKSNDNDWIYSNLFWVSTSSSKDTSSSLLDIIFKTRKRQWSRKAVLEYTTTSTTSTSLNGLFSSADSIKSDSSTISNVSSVINTTTYINTHDHSTNTSLATTKHQQQEQHKNMNNINNNNNNNTSSRRSIKNIKITLPTSPTSSSLVSPTSPTSLFMSPTSSSAKPSHSSVSLVDHRYQPNDSQTSLFSTKTTSSINHPTSPISPKRSTSKSNRRQAVWKSIVKTS